MCTNKAVPTDYQKIQEYLEHTKYASYYIKLNLTSCVKNHQINNGLIRARA